MDRTTLEERIFLIRGKRVMFGADLADLFEVTPKRLNEQVRRNPLRFPPDFAFRVSRPELAEVVAKCGHLTTLKHAPVAPRVFTEHGALMLANVLNSERAIKVSIEVVRAFCRLKAAYGDLAGLAAKLEALERRYDKRFATIFEAIRHLIEHEPPKLRRIGFLP